MYSPDYNPELVISSWKWQIALWQENLKHFGHCNLIPDTYLYSAKEKISIDLFVNKEETQLFIIYIWSKLMKVL